MKLNNTLKLAVASAVLAASQSSLAAISTISQDFEGNTGTLGTDGWLNFISQTGGGTYSFPLDGAAQVATIASGEGGVAQGNDHLNVFSNYDDASHGFTTLEVSVFQQMTTDVSDIGKTFDFSFDAKAPAAPNGSPGGTVAIDPGTGATARAFVKVFGPGFSFFAFDLSFDTTNLADDAWVSETLSFTLNAANPGDWDGWIIQAGFSNISGNYADSGVLYDNVNISAVPVPAAAWLMGSALLGLVGVKRSRK